MGRIADIPRRAWTDGAEDTAAYWTEQLRTSGGQQQLRPIQGVAIDEVVSVGGAYLAVEVGGGKTHIAACAPAATGAQRPLMVVPGGLLGKGNKEGKTERELRELATHWKLPAHYPLASYQKLSRANQEDFFRVYRPDLIVFDEAQALKNKDTAAVIRRLLRFEGEFPGQCQYLFLSGSPTLNSVCDFAHLLLLALGEGSPLPMLEDLWKEWGSILDSRPGRYVDFSCIRRELGPCSSIEQARGLMHDRLHSTPGLIITDKSFDWPLEIERRAWASPLDQFYADLRNEFEAPDGFDLTEAIEVRQHCLRLSVGLVHTQDPWPPDDWRRARRDYNGVVRDAIKSGEYDTEAQVRQAIENGDLPDDEYRAWIKIRPTHPVNIIKEMWDDQTILKVVKAWMSEGEGGIIWVHHTELGRFLADKLGLLYYGEGGTARDGTTVDARTKKPYKRFIVASCAACGTGYNLQYEFHRSFFVEFPSNAQLLEQAIGRTHRPGQERTVSVALPWACLEHKLTYDRMMQDAQYVQDQWMGQKLLQAPVKAAKRFRGPAWDPPEKQEEE